MQIREDVVNISITIVNISNQSSDLPEVKDIDSSCNFYKKPNTKFAILRANNIVEHDGQKNAREISVEYRGSLEFIALKSHSIVKHDGKNAHARSERCDEQCAM